jgi:hypothetical protein
MANRDTDFYPAGIAVKFVAAFRALDEGDHFVFRFFRIFRQGVCLKPNLLPDFPFYYSMKRKKSQRINFNRLMKELDAFPEWEIKKYRGPLYSVRSDEHRKHITWCYSLEGAIEQLVNECRSRYPNLSNTTR